MRSLLCGLTACVMVPWVLAADDPVRLDLWPGKPPGESAVAGEKKDMTKPTDREVAGRRVIRVGNVSKPTLTLYRPAKDKDTGTAVIVCPGGGYNILAWDLEGTEVCAWLNSLGVTAVLLEYRVPSPRTPPRHIAPVQDGQRALSLVRSKAKEWGIDPSRIGVLGFSAGGHLAAVCATGYEKRLYEPIDAIDKVSCRPDFAVLIYPGYLATAKRDALAPELRVTKETPPMFLVHAGNDPVPVENSVLMYLALRKVGVPAELHVFPTGGHGYGLRRTEQPVTRWPERCAEWLKDRGLLRAK